jgi:hypothetical protein
MGFFGGNSNLIKRVNNRMMNTTDLLHKARTQYRKGNRASFNRALAMLRLRRGRTGNAALSKNQLNQIDNLNQWARRA